MKMELLFLSVFEKPKRLLKKVLKNDIVTLMLSFLFLVEKSGYDTFFCFLMKNVLNKFLVAIISKIGNRKIAEFCDLNLYAKS